MKIYSVECISGQVMGPCGLFSTMNLAISEVIRHNNFRTDLPVILNDDSQAQIVYKGNNDYDYTEYCITEYELNTWED